MVGKRAEAEAISKWLGSLGQVSSPPFYYFLIEAAQVLNCSVFDLESAENKLDWITRAMTYQKGRSEGERLMRRNPEFKAAVRAESKATEIK